MYPKVVYLVVLLNYAPKPTPKPFILSMNYISEESQESPIFMQFWQILNHMTHSEANSEDQQSTFKGEYSPKSLYKLALPENGFTFYFYDIETL